MSILYKLYCLIYPEKCPYCGELIKSEAIACDRCRKRLDQLQKPVIRGVQGYRCVSSFIYGGSVRRMILRIKYHERIQYIPQVAEVMVRDIRAVYSGAGFDCVTYVPMHPDDEKKRRFNQSELLAKEIGKRLELPCAEMLVKIKRTKQQHSLKYVERKKNLNGAFKVTDKDLAAGKSILLIDDIVTSGYTLGSCCRTLSRAKPRMICCAAIADAQHHLSDTAII